MKKRLIILDFDGTVLDSSPEGKRRLRVLCEINGISFNKEKQAKVYAEWGNPVIPMLVKGLEISEEKAKEINRQWEVWDHVEPVRLMKGTRETLAYIKRRKFDMVLFTSRHTKNVAEIINFHLIDDFFSCVVGIEGDAHGNLPAGEYRKKDPESFRGIVSYVAHTHDTTYDKLKVIYVGDTEIDVAQAMNAGLDVIAVMTGEKKEEDFLRIGVPSENILLSIKELPEWMKKFWK